MQEELIAFDIERFNMDDTGRQSVDFMIDGILTNTSLEELRLIQAMKFLEGMLNFLSLRDDQVTHVELHHLFRQINQLGHVERLLEPDERQLKELTELERIGGSYKILIPMFLQTLFLESDH